MSKALMTFLVLFTGLAISGCSLLPQEEASLAPAILPTAEEQDMTSIENARKILDEVSSKSGDTTTTYTMAEVQTHNTKTDCWTVIEGSVYDLTSVTSADSHPGGPVIENACGADGSVLFAQRNGKGPHPDKAQMGVEALVIGVLVE